MCAKTVGSDGVWMCGMLQNSPVLGKYFSGELWEADDGEVGDDNALEGVHKIQPISDDPVCFLRHFLKIARGVIQDTLEGGRQYPLKNEESIVFAVVHP